MLTSRNGETIEALKKQNDKDSRLHETTSFFNLTYTYIHYNDALEVIKRTSVLINLQKTLR